MVASIIIAIAIFDMFFIGNKQLNKVGLGVARNIIFLSPLMLLYHPHKGPRNVPLDLFTMTLYVLSISLTYFLSLLAILGAI